MQYQVKRLELGGILDQAFSILRNHAGLLFGIVATTIIPFQIATSIIQLVLMQNLTTAAEIQTATIMVVVPALVIGLPLTVLVNAAVIHAIARVYLSQPTTIGECFAHGLKRFLPLLGTSLLVGLAIAGGMILCIIPGIVFAVWFGLAQQVTVLESSSGVEALGRSRALMKGNVGTAIALGLIIWVIAILLSLGAKLIPQVHIQLFLSAVIQGATTLFVTAVSVVFYFSCRCKLENFDLQLLAEAVGIENTGESADGVPAFPSE